MILDNEPCCLDRNPVAQAGAVRTHPNTPDAPNPNAGQTNSIIAAINGQTTDLEAALLAQTTSITANIQAIVDTLDAGIDVNSTQAGAWTFTVAGQPVEVALDAATLTALQDLLEASDLTTQIGGQDVVLDVNVTGQPLAVTTSLQPVIDAIQAVVRVDYERTGYCVVDSNGEKVPLVGVFAQVSYNSTGAVASTELVLSQLVGTTWQTYNLGAGEVVAECPENSSQSLAPEVGGSITLQDGQTFTFPPNAKSISIAPNEEGATFDFVGGIYGTLDSAISASWSNSDGSVLSNSDDGEVTAKGGTVIVSWEA